MPEAGGRVAYTAPVTLNEGKGVLTVAGFNEGFAEVMRRLRSSLNAPDLPLTGGFLNTTLRDEEGVLRLLAFHLPAHSRTLVVTVEQSPSEYEASERALTTRPTVAVDPFPDSEPRFYVNDDNRNVSMCVSDTPAAADSVRAYFESRFHGDGWLPVVPASDKATPRLLLYMRGADLGCMYVGPSTDGTHNVITVLHKRQAVK
jgi:hypothetical protein